MRINQNIIQNIRFRPLKFLQQLFQQLKRSIINLTLGCFGHNFISSLFSRQRPLPCVSQTIEKPTTENTLEILAAPTKKGKGKNGKLKICLLTTGPGKTLGDASLCEKLATSLLEKYDVDIDTRLHLIEDSQKDKTQNLFKHLDQEHPGQHKLIIEGGNLDFNHQGFDPNDYDIIIPFAAYNLFEEDFKLKTQFFNEKPNMALFKTDDVKALIQTAKFQKHCQEFNHKDNSLITFIQEDNGSQVKHFANVKNITGQDNLIELNEQQVLALNPYFSQLEKDKFYIFAEDDSVRAAEFDVQSNKDSGAHILTSKKPASENDKKSHYFNTAYQLQTLVKDLAASQQIPVKDKCIFLTRYDYFSDEYLASLKDNDLELLGVDRGVKGQFSDMFAGGKIQNIQTGFGKGKQGIMLPKVPADVNLDSADAVKNNMEKDDTAIVDLLYGNESKQAYEQNNELFFGYHNIIPNTDISALPIKGYIKTCLDITANTPGKEKKNIDFVLNIYPDDGDASETCKISEVLNGIDLDKYDVEFWKKNPDNKMEKLKSVGACDGQKPVVRLMNPFGIKSQSFLTLLRLAHPLTLQTGNSSIIEALYLGKAPLYQLTSWSTDFLTALERYIEDTLGKDARYATVFRTANDPKIELDDKVKIISDIYRNHAQELKQELSKLDSSIKNNMDLYKNLPTVLKDKFQIPLTEKPALIKQREDKLLAPPKALLFGPTKTKPFITRKLPVNKKRRGMRNVRRAMVSSAA